MLYRLNNSWQSDVLPEAGGPSLEHQHNCQKCDHIATSAGTDQHIAQAQI